MIAILFCGGCTAAGATQPKATFRQLKGGGFAASSSASPQVVLAHDADAYLRIWNVLIGAGVPPDVDFARETAVFLLDRQRPTGGYSLEPRSVAVEGDTAVVKVTTHAPKRGSMTSQVLTTPFAVIALSRTGIGAARWVDADHGTVVAESAKKP